MIYLLFAFLFGLLFLFFKQSEKQDDYILLAFAFAFLFFELAVWANTDVYSKIGYIEKKDCSYSYFNVSSTEFYQNGSTCLTTYLINYNTSQGYFNVNNFFAFRSFDTAIIDLSGIVMFFLLIVGVLYISYKSLKAFNYIK